MLLDVLYRLVGEPTRNNGRVVLVVCRAARRDGLSQDLAYRCGILRRCGSDLDCHLATVWHVIFALAGRGQSSRRTRSGGTPALEKLDEIVQRRGVPRLVTFNHGRTNEGRQLCRVLEPRGDTGRRKLHGDERGTEASAPGSDGFAVDDPAVLDDFKTVGRDVNAGVLLRAATLPVRATFLEVFGVVDDGCCVGRSAPFGAKSGICKCFKDLVDGGRYATFEDQRGMVNRGCTIAIDDRHGWLQIG